MSAITNRMNDLNRAKNIIPDFMMEILAYNSDYIEELNRMQLSQGLRIDGGVLPNYSQTSVNVFGKPKGPMKLYDTGDFYSGIKEQLFDDRMELIGEDSKTEMLEEKYGDVVGLTETSKDKLVSEILRPKLQERIKKLING